MAGGDLGADEVPVGCGDPAFRGGTASIEVFANDAVHFAHHILLTSGDLKADEDIVKPGCTKNSQFHDACWLRTSGHGPSGNPAFCAGLTFSQSTGNVPICRVQKPHLVAPRLSIMS